MTVDELAERLVTASAALGGRRRLVVGIAGPPGAGKTTVSFGLRDAVDARLGLSAAQVAPMDGFHLTNAELARRGLRDRKGCPETFEAEAFVRAVERLRAEPPARLDWPAYDRTLHEPVPGAIVVTPGTVVAIVEGNYLLLPSRPWSRLRALLDVAWYLDEDEDVRSDRLVARYVAGGRTLTDARARVASYDRANARLVEAAAHRADERIQVA